MAEVNLNYAANSHEPPRSPVDKRKETPIASPEFKDVLDISAENNIIQIGDDGSRCDNLPSHLPPPTPSSSPSPPWCRRLAASFSAMADQMTTFSLALELLSADAHSYTEAPAIYSRVEALEKRHEHLSAEFGELKSKFNHLDTSSNDDLGAKIDDLTKTIKLE
jgi:hypothetical protein